MASKVDLKQASEWKRPQYFAGYLARAYYIFRANAVPNWSDGLPFKFCAGPYPTKASITTHLRRTSDALIAEW